MKPIETVVFLDLVPDYDNPNKIVAVNVLTAPRRYFLEFVGNKTTTIQPQYMLTLSFRDESDFNEEAANVINAFVSQQKPPVCLFAHNGNRFDFPILKLMFENVNVSLSDDVMCADSCLAFYDVKELEPFFFGNAVRAKFNDGNPRPEASYDLWDIYGRVYSGSDRIERRKRENDNKAAFRIALYLGNKLLNWVDQKQRPFSQVNPTDLLYRKV